MKLKLFIILLIIISALIVLGDEIKTVYKDKATLFEFEEESTTDGYRWLLENVSPNMKVSIKGTTQQVKDSYKIIFTKSGNYTLIFKYKNGDKVKKSITKNIKVVELIKDGWYTNWDIALEDAKKSKKLVILLFTGSDWCGPCKSLESKIIKSSEFKRLAKDNFILYKADFPKHIEQDFDTKLQNSDLKDKYPIKGYPTIYILNNDGSVIGKVVGYDGELVNFLKKIVKENKK